MLPFAQAGRLAALSPKTQFAGASSSRVVVSPRRIPSRSPLVWMLPASTPRRSIKSEVPIHPQRSRAFTAKALTLSQWTDLMVLGPVVSCIDNFCSPHCRRASVVFPAWNCRRITLSGRQDGPHEDRRPRPSRRPSGLRRRADSRCARGAHSARRSPCRLGCRGGLA